MPRTPRRGGRRQGQVGKLYPNRTDAAQAPKAAPSQTYGEGAESLRAQRAIPLPNAAPTTAGAGAMLEDTPPPPVPGGMPFGRGTDRPGEPLTAGLAVGAGPGPSAAMPAVDPVVETLRAAYRAFPNESIAALLEAMESR